MYVNYINVKLNFEYMENSIKSLIFTENMVDRTSHVMLEKKTPFSSRKHQTDVHLDKCLPIDMHCHKPKIIYQGN